MVDTRKNMTDNLSDKQTDSQSGRQYNFVSLGYFCSVALELDRIGLRQESFPFDWLITESFESVMNLIKNNFNCFLLKENLYQESNISPNYYYDNTCKIHFYHDFNSVDTLDNQYDKIKEKYDKRIERFYNRIKSPTIFIRYCCNKDEIDYIQENRTNIELFLKSFNSENKIIYISDIKNTGLDWVYYVKKGKHGGVARKFLKKLPQLDVFLRNSSLLTKEQIIRNKKRYKRNILKRYIRKVKRKLNKFFQNKPYIHSNQYDTLKKT